MPCKPQPFSFNPFPYNQVVNNRATVLQSNHSPYRPVVKLQDTAPAVRPVSPVSQTPGDRQYMKQTRIRERYYTLIG